MGQQEEYRLEIIARLGELLEKVLPVEADRGSQTLGREDQLRHVASMLSRMEVFVMERRFAKADRWIGFVQGTLWALGVRSIDQFRAMNTAP